MKIYLLRHGETNWNKERKMACKLDSVLNETGIKQAEEAQKLLGNVKYDLVISSPLSRAKRTAEIVNNEKKPLIIDERLEERNVGVLDGKSLTEINLTEFFDYNKNVEYEGAENIQDFCERIWGFLDDIKVKYRDKDVLLVTHNIVIRAMKAYFLGIPEDGNIRRYGIKNAQIEEYNI